MKKRLIILIVTLSFGIAFSLPANANPQALGTCLVDSLNGKERKQLAKWIYFSMAAHPEMKPFSNISAEDRTDADKYVASLITRLLVEDCASQVKVAQKSDPLALPKSFEIVGKVAMQELTTNQDVMTAISNYGHYLDQNRINSLFVEK